MNQRIGFVSQYTDGTWTTVSGTDSAARRFARESVKPINRKLVALPVSVDLPDVAPRPAVFLSDGTRIRWNVARGVFVALMTDYASVVALAKALPVADGDIDALQALKADTLAWIAAGGVDAG